MAGSVPYPRRSAFGIEHSRELSIDGAANTVVYLVGVVDVPDEGVDPVFVVRRGPLGPEVSQGRRGVEEV